jgi:hypothetical protein
MIDVKELLYDIDLKLNKVATNEHQNIPLEDKLIALNDAQINLIKTKFSENNLYKAGLDSFQKRYNDLEVLVEKNGALDLEDESTLLNSWSADLNKLNPKYMLGVPGSEYITANKGECKNLPLFINQVRHGDISVALKNTNMAPSFEYQEVPGVISSHKWQIFTDGTFTPKKLFLWYIRYPEKVDYEGYIHLDGTPSRNINSELPYYLKEELVDVAVKSLALYTGNQGAAQAAQVKIQSNE